jgi:hypothetical protein
MASTGEILRLISQLSGGSSTARASAAKVLGEQGDPSAIAPLVKALTDPDRSVRQQSVITLGLLGDSSVASYLESMLRDPNIDIRLNAVAALADVGAVSAVPRLAVLRDTDPRAEIRNAAADTIRRLHDGQQSSDQAASPEVTLTPDHTPTHMAAALEVSLRFPTAQPNEFIRVDGTILNTGLGLARNLTLELSGHASGGTQTVEVPNELEPNCPVDWDAAIKPLDIGSVPLTWRLSFDDDTGSRRQQTDTVYITVEEPPTGPPTPSVTIDNLFQGPIVSGDLLESGAVKQDEGVILQKGGKPGSPENTHPQGYCDKGGEKLPAMPDAPKFCPSCGETLTE